MVSIITRLLENVIFEKLKPGLVIGLFGTRRTGKTFLMERLKSRLPRSNWTKIICRQNKTWSQG